MTLHVVIYITYAKHTRWYTSYDAVVTCLFPQFPDSRHFCILTRIRQTCQHCYYCYSSLTGLYPRLNSHSNNSQLTPSHFDTLKSCYWYTNLIKDVSTMPRHMTRTYSRTLIASAVNSVSAIGRNMTRSQLFRWEKLIISSNTRQLKEDIVSFATFKLSLKIYTCKKRAAIYNNTKS